MMRNRIAPAALSMAALMFASASPVTPPPRATAPQNQDDEDDERAFALELGRRSFEGNCLMCHSAGMVEGLRLTPEQWATAVDKMIGWGAPVPPEEKEGLVAYLVERFPAGAEPPAPPRLSLDQAEAATRPEPGPDDLPPGDPTRGAALHAEHCTTCHGPDGSGGDLGINLLARPVLHRPGEYFEILNDGRRRMPGFRLVLAPEQMADTLAWLRSQSE